MKSLKLSKRGLYYVPRVNVTPPKELVDMVFPLLPASEAEFEARTDKDIAGACTLKCLRWLAIVFLQVNKKSSIDSVRIVLY